MNLYFTDMHVEEKLQYNIGLVNRFCFPYNRGRKEAGEILREESYMGVYLNPDNKSFRDAIRSEIYVDKTGLIAHTNECINTEQRFICVSRPRRFGKSMALKMLAAYYSRGCDSRGMFECYKIKNSESFGEHLNKYDVIYLNMQQFLIRARKQEVTEYLEQAVMEELREFYGDLFSDRITVLAEALEKILRKPRRNLSFWLTNGTV